MDGAVGILWVDARLHVEVGHRDGRETVTTQLLHMEEELVREVVQKIGLAILNVVQVYIICVCMHAKLC